MERPSSLEVQENGVIEDITVLPSHKDMDTVHAAEQTSVPWAFLEKLVGQSLAAAAVFFC